MSKRDASFVEHYWENGYCVVEDCVDRAWIDAFVGDLGAAARGQLAQLGLPAEPGSGLDVAHQNLVAVHRRDQNRYLAMLRLLSRTKSLYDVLLSDGITGVCSSLGVKLPVLHTLPLFHLLSNRLKITGGYHGFEAHQDWSALQTSINAVIVWLPFHDLGLDGFPLEVLPHSHHRGVLPSSVTDGEYKIDATSIDQSRFVALQVPKGGVVFLTPFTVHRTGMTGGEALRIAGSWRYEDALEPSFISRGYPLAQGKTVRHEPFFPGFPTAADVAKVIEQNLNAAKKAASPAPKPRRNGSSD